eukprot:TRINITY_DN53_c0_g1_i1.p1 TRINITY_DN53_c0_g1~~TRINITY_DN53_c0_g1_i1.p1  ORF type:complete len:372 (-),score=137.43 TRINITY_DN53_c0_g1_i1:253-1368(-)
MKAFFVLALCVAIVAAVGDKLRKGDPNAILSEIDSTSFGNTILSTIAIQLATNGPLEEIAVALNQARKLIEKQQEEDDDGNRTNQAQCDTTISTFQQQVALHTTQRGENLKILESSQGALDQANVDLREAIKGLQVNDKRLSTGQSERENQNAAYNQATEEHEQGIKAIDAALKLLNHLKSGTSFIQLKRKFEAVTDQLVETQHSSSKGHLYTPLIESLTQLADHASPEIIDKIIKLFNELRNSFVQDKQSLTKIENQQVEAWSSLKADLETERETLQTKRADLERQIEGYQKIIQDADNNVKFHTVELGKAEENLANQDRLCTQLSEDYASRTEERKREMDIIHRVIESFEKKIKTMSEFVKGRVESSSL